MAAVLMTAVFLRGSAAAQSLPVTELKAAFLFNFALFVEWPADVVPAQAALILCVVDDDAVADTLERLSEGRKVHGHNLTVRRLKAGAAWPTCNVLYLAGADLKRSLAAIETVKDGFMFTVSDAPHFAEAGGMVELFVEDGRMRFAVNMDALRRAHVKLSSHVLALAKIVKEIKAPPV